MNVTTRRHFLVQSAVSVCALALRAGAAETTDAIRKALAAHDRAVLVKTGWLRDPMIFLSKDGYFYLTGTTLPPQAEKDFVPGDKTGPGWHVRAWRSRDLVAWEDLGDLTSLKETPYFKTAHAAFEATPERQWHVWAPELHQREDGRWGLVFTVPPPLRPAVGAALMLSETSDLHGPWSSPMGDRVGLRHDPSLFQDDDKTWWMIWGNTAIAPLKPDWSGYAAPPTQLKPADSDAMGHEGCTILKIDGKYVLFGTGWSTSRWRKGTYNLYYAVADKITGPYGKRRLAGRFLGHGTPFQDKQGRWWCTAFPNANKPAVPAEGIEKLDTGDDALTINPVGLTLVPLSVKRVGDDIAILALDPHYATPGPDEAPHWTGKIEIG